MGRMPNVSALMCLGSGGALAGWAAWTSGADRQARTRPKATHRQDRSLRFVSQPFGKTVFPQERQARSAAYGAISMRAAYVAFVTAE